MAQSKPTTKPDPTGLSYAVDTAIFNARSRALGPDLHPEDKMTLDSMKFELGQRLDELQTEMNKIKAYEASLAAKHYS